MKRYEKSEKISDLLKHAISNALLFELEVEELKWITITSVKMNKDNTIAEVFYLTVEPNIKREEAENLLKENLFRLKKYLSSKLRLKKFPELIFKYDEVEEKARRIEEIIEKIPKKENGNG